MTCELKNPVQGLPQTDGLSHYVCGMRGFCLKPALTWQLMEAGTKGLGLLEPRR